jgi:hypothetical protein
MNITAGGGEKNKVTIQREIKCSELGEECLLGEKAEITDCCYIQETKQFRDSLICFSLL